MTDSLGPHGLTAACQAPVSSTISWSLHKFLPIESVMLYNYLIFCCPLLSSSIFPSINFSSELTLCIRWPKYWSFSPSNEYLRLISFRIDWVELVEIHWASQESSPALYIQSINSLMLNLLYGPILIGVLGKP